MEPVAVTESDHRKMGQRNPPGTVRAPWVVLRICRPGSVSSRDFCWCDHEVCVLFDTVSVVHLDRPFLYAGSSVHLRYDRLMPGSPWNPFWEF